MLTLGLWEWITIASCVGHLALATISLLRLSKSPIALPLALLCLDLFVFNAADAANQIVPADQWRWLDATFTSLMAPLSIRFVLVFVGRRRQLALLAYAFDLYFGVTALACAGAFVGIPWSRDFAGLSGWAKAVTPGAVAAIATLAWLFASHLKGTTSRLEKERTWLVIGAFALGTAGNVCDLLVGLGFHAPRLGPLGLFLSTLVLTITALGIGLFGQRVSALIAANALILAVVQLFGYFVVYSVFGGNSTVLAIGVGTLTLALVPTALAMTRAWSARQQELEQQATLGDFILDVEHDLRNPVATIRSAAQFIQKALPPDQIPPDVAVRLKRIVDKSDAMTEMITEHRRNPSLEPLLQSLDVNPVVAEVVQSQQGVAPAGVEIESRLGTSGVRCEGDARMLTRALDNLIRNAWQAMPNGGRITVQTEIDPAKPGSLLLSVADNGPGMDLRLAKAVLEGGLTTKSDGSGRGLAYVRRTARSHNGELRIDPGEGRGAKLTIVLPIRG